MAPALLSLLGFAAWTLLLVAGLVLARTVPVGLGKRRANDWPRGGPSPEGEPEVMQRLRDAHLNTAENLPIFAAIVAVAAASGNLASIDSLAPYVLAARVAQSLTHLKGTTHWHVFTRASFFSLQLGLQGWMIWRLLAGGGG